MIISKTMARLRPRILVWAGVVFTIVWMPANGPAKPRAPLPPLPELAPLLYRASFDEPAASVDAKAERSPASGDFVESWSGYALSRTARSAAPFVIPGLDAGGRANLAPAEGSIRFWFRPAWTSAGRAKGGGPGDTATLLEMIALGQKDALVLWTLAVSPDGSTLSLAGATGAGAEVLLRAPFDWQAGESHLVTLNYGAKGTDRKSVV